MLARNSQRCVEFADLSSPTGARFSHPYGLVPSVDPTRFATVNSTNRKNTGITAMAVL